MSWDITRVHTNTVTTSALITEEKQQNHLFQEHEDNVGYHSLGVKADI